MNIKSISNCQHKNTIDAGDEEHSVVFCIDCGSTDLAVDTYATYPDAFISEAEEQTSENEYSAQHQAIEFIQKAEKLNRELTHSDALSEEYNDDPQYKIGYE